MKKIFAQAQKLMIAQQAAIVAKAEEEDATAELIRLNGSATINLADESRRFFECEGDMETRLKYGPPPGPDAQREKCDSIVAVASYYIVRNTQRPESTPICEACQTAERLRQKDVPPEPARAFGEPAATSTKVEEIPF